METIRNLSIRKTIVLYLTVSLILGFLAGAAVMGIAEQAQRQIWIKYIDEDAYVKAIQKEEGNFTVDVARVSRDRMTKTDGFYSELCDFLETYSILAACFFSMIGAVILFYRDKIKVPLGELTDASELIGKNELDFRITYASRDELGRLCLEFEKMRASLAENNRNMWNMVEEEKALRAAIAHDIRSPLAVLRGYQEMMLEFIPEGILEQKKILEMLQGGMEQIERMDKFIGTMQKLSRLEARRIECREFALSSLTDEILRIAQILQKEAGRESHIIQTSADKKITADREVILEVIDNLLSNAFRYAERLVQVEIRAEGRELVISVSDDGSGFTESQEQVTKAYYHSNPQDDLQHFGMGMYISRVYCEKHGGRLLTGNQRDGGAVVKAVFRTGE